MSETQHQKRGDGVLAALAKRIACALLTLAFQLPAMATPPSRVMSLNLCTDQLLLALADRRDIASVTYLARDCTISAHCRDAAAVPINYGTAEELIAAEPELVLAGRYTARPAIGVAQRLGMTVIELSPSASLDDIRNQIKQVAAALGRPERGAAMIADLDGQFGRMTSGTDEHHPVAAVYQANGMTVGAGSLIDAALRAAGFDNLTHRLGLENYVSLPLEILIANRPDILILNSARTNYTSLAESILQHPAIAAAMPASHRVVVPQALWVCGGPEVGQAVSLLEKVRAGLGEPHP